MFSIDDLFTQIFPWLEGVSWDLGTILSSLVFLWFLIMAFDWVMEMMGTKIGGYTSTRKYKYFMSEAEKHEQEAMGLASGSLQREYHEKMMGSYLGDAVKAKRRKI